MWSPSQPSEPEFEWEPPDREEVRLYEWRLQRLEGLGFNRYQADALIDRGVDWHEAERMVARVSDVDIAFDLLS